MALARLLTYIFLKYHTLARANFFCDHQGEAVMSMEHNHCVRRLMCVRFAVSDAAKSAGTRVF